MIYVFATSSTTADRWARERGFARRHFRAFGEWSHYYNTRYTDADRIVILGDVTPRMLALIDHDRRQSTEVTVERLPAP